MVVGIIAEYNPFHNGHRYQIEQIRKKVKDATIVAVMSGNFTQRGEAAILDKFTRAELAINGGCDLVLELPFVFAVRSAQDFARGAINLLKNLGIVDILAFGAEIDDIKLLQKAAKILDTSEFNQMLRDDLSKGISYASATCQVLSKILSIDEKILRLPNLILAIEYLRALNATLIKPLLIPRVLSQHNEKKLHSNISSATAIRTSVYLKKTSWDQISETIDNKTLEVLKKSELPSMENLFKPLIMKIICSKITELENIYGMNEGLENKLISSARSSENFETLVNSLVSQRYTRTRIQRLILHFLIKLQKEDIAIFDSDSINYARILAFNQQGRNLIHLIKKTTNIPIINKVSKHILSRDIYKQSNNLKVYQKMLYFDIISSDIFSILYPNIKLGQDFIKSPYYNIN